MRKGENRASQDYQIKKLIHNAFKNDQNFSNSPCIFLSHKKEDKGACLEIGQYLSDAGIDYYLDIYDEGLQIASNENDPQKITECLKNGIRLSTNMIVVLSEKTKNSQWVPFEIGYGHASIVDKTLNQQDSKSSLNLAFLTLKEISDIPIPDFLRIAYPIRGIRSLNEYLERIKPIEHQLKKNRAYSNNLSTVLDSYR